MVGDEARAVAAVVARGSYKGGGAIMLSDAGEDGEIDPPAHSDAALTFWSLVKNGIRGVYHNLGANYLEAYFDEYAFRYNRRLDEKPSMSGARRHLP